MVRSAYDLKAFYNSRTGRVVRRILQARLREFWPDVKNMQVLGCGYAVPYLRSFMEESERTFAVMPARQGVHHWPPDGKNIVCMAEDSELPIETSSVDRVLLIHHLEFTELQQPALAEIWRIMEGNGRLLVVVPRRSGLWAHAEWSPFGQGTPYTAAQITQALHENLFVHERTEESLFMPPLRSSLALKSAGFFEPAGRYLPFLAGVHIVEASKQLYARADKGSGSKVTVRGRGLFGIRPMPVPQG